MVTNSKSETIESKLNVYFESHKFFQSGDINGKKSFFCLGLYTRSIMACLEKSVAENGAENKEQARLTRYATRNMSYKNFTMLAKMLDGFALRCNTKLLNCGGLSRQYLANAEFTSDKDALSVIDSNNAFSLGLYQQLK